MLTKIHKWGNSFAIRIPKSLASEARFEKDSIIEMSIIDKQIIIEAVKVPKYSLEKLLSGISHDNIHSETETGKVVGNEIW